MKILEFTVAAFSRVLPACFIILLFNSHALATTHIWLGTFSSDWNTALNWSPASVPTSSDDVNIGTNVLGFNNQPSITTGTTIANAASITFGLFKPVTLTVGAGYTLKTGAIVQNSAVLLVFGTFTTTLAGSGNINCSSITVGNNNVFPPILTINSLYMVSTITGLHVTGNVLVNSTNFGVTVLNVGFNNATFSLQGGTTLIDGTITTTNTVSGILPLTSATPKFSIDMPSGSTLNPLLQLSSTTAINTASAAGSIDFYNNTGGTGTCTVNYCGTDQTIYTNTTACLDNSLQTYQNLTLSGAGTKTVGTVAGSTLSIGKDLANSATTTDLATYNPIVTIGNNWINSGNVTGGSGNITVTNLLQNNSNTITLATGATTIGSGGVQLNGGSIIAGAGTLTDNGLFQNNGGLLNCGTAASASVIFKGNYFNRNTGTFTANPSSTSSVYFSGTTQTLQDSTTNGTTFNNVQFTGTTATIKSGTGNFSVAGTGVLTMGSNVTLTAGPVGVTGAGYLTLLSTGTSSASTAQIPTSSVIKGNVNVQRFVSGGSVGFRGYRLLSSPININNLTSFASSTGYMGLTYLNSGTNSILTAGPGGAASGFSVANFNPLIYLYDESLPTNNSSFVSGKNIGIAAISGTLGSPAYSVTTLSGYTYTSGVTIPIGNSILLYYVGSTASTVINNTRTPDNAIATAVGYLNQGDVPVVFWKTNSTSIPYHSNGGYLPGLNQVGNPYASTISLDQLYADNNTLSPQFWELNDQVGGAYIAYNASSGATSNLRASKYIVSGQGFIMQAKTTGQTITFKEDQKVSYPASFIATTTTGPALLLSMPSAPSVTSSDNLVFASAATPASQSNSASPSGLHLQLSADSTTSNQTGIYFNNNWSDNYNPGEDAADISPVTRIHLSSLSADGLQLEINELGDYTKGKRIRLYASATITGTYTMSLADVANIDTGANNIYLVDKKTNDSLDMVRYRSYAFNINTGDTSTYGSNRFVLAIKPTRVSQDTSSLSSTKTNTQAINNMAIYPNPSNSIVNVSLSGNAPANYTEDIYDMSGKLIKHSSQTSNTFTEDISSYKLGIYIIQLKSASGNLLGKSKFVKTN